MFEGFCFDKGLLANFNKKSRPYCFLPSVLIGDHCSSGYSYLSLMSEADLEVAVLLHAESVPFSTATSETASPSASLAASLATLSFGNSSSEIGSKCEFTSE